MKIEKKFSRNKNGLCYLSLSFCALIREFAYTKFIKSGKALFQKTINLFVFPPKVCISIVFNFSWDYCK